MKGIKEEGKQSIRVQEGIYPNGKKAFIFVCVIFVIFLTYSSNLFAATVSVSPSKSNYKVGDTVTVSWSGFSGNVGVKVYLNGVWVDSAINYSGSSWNITLGSDWQVRNDFKIKVTQTSNGAIYAEYGPFTVHNPSISCSPSTGTTGQTFTASHSGFYGSINGNADINGINSRNYSSNGSGSALFVPSQGESGTWTVTVSSAADSVIAATCNFSVTAQPVNGQCGSANGQTYTTPPLTNLCSVGSSSSVTGSGPWYWTCYGSYGGFNASCSANAAPLPDLTGSATVASSYTAGSSVQIPVTVSKSGADLTSGTYAEAKLYWSTNNTWDASDTTLWTSNNGVTPDFPNTTLNSSGSKTVTATVTIPNVSNGTYYIIAYVDPSNFHSEGEENNNITVYAVTIGVQAASPTLTPLYRLYNPSIKDHFYTTSVNERDTNVAKTVPQKFNYERVEGFVSSVNFTGSIPLYRLYKTVDDIHFYTSSEPEKNAKIAAGYTLEQDKTYYIYQTQKEWTSPLYFASHSANTDNFYTTSWYEYKNAIDNWSFTGHGIIGYVATKIANNRPQGNFAGVGMASGNFSLPAFTDLALNGVGPQLSFTRYYDSYSPGSTLGQGWSFNYDSFILEDTAGVHVEWGNGSESHFDTSLNPLPGYFEKALKIEDGSNYGYDITTKDQTVYQFRRLSPSNIPLTKITDKHNNSLSLSRYGGYGVVISAKDKVDVTAREFTFEYTPFTLSTGHIVQRLTKVTDTSINRFVTMSYYTSGNAQGNLQTVTDARGNTTTYAYNADGFLNTISYPEGNTVNVTYDDLGRAAGYTNGSISLSFDYNATTGTTVKNGTSTLVNFLPDTQKRASKVTYADDAADYSQPTYCPGNLLNQPCNVRDRNGKTTTYTYDANGNVLTIKNPLNETTTFTYDPLGKNNLISVEDPRHNTTSYGYDATYINLLSVTKPMGGSTTYSGHDTRGLVGTVTDPTGHSITYTYGDTLHYLPTRISDNALSTYIEYTYDGAGRRRTQTDQQQPTRQVTTWVYDNNDNVTSVQVGSNPAAQFRYDMNNRLYNVVDQRGKATVYTYNNMNLLYTQQSPDSKNWTYNYDSIGNLAIVTLPDSSSVSYTYDANKRLQYVRYNGTEKLFYTYDNNGNILSLRKDSFLTNSFVYNAANRVTSITDPDGNLIGYGYDQAGNRTSITYPGNKLVNYTFDADNRLATVKDWLGAATTTYSYNTAGILKSIVNANGTSSTFGHDTANRLTWMSNQKSQNNYISGYELTLDKMGNPTSITRNEPLAPPIPTMSDTGYGYNDANQILNAGSVTYTHDALGNLNGASNGKSFTFDYANRMAGATIGGDNYSFLYDAFGNRIARSKNGTRTDYYILDLNAGMSNVLAETDSVGTVKNYYIHGLGLISRINGAGHRFTYHYDQIGNTVAVTDDSNNVTESYTYDEFGQVLASNGATSNPFRYVGQFGVMDEGNGFLYMRARYYDTAKGRFLSRDPLGFEGGDLNLYAYGKNNPLINIDPKGEFAVIAVLGVVYTGYKAITVLKELGLFQQTIKRYRYYEGVEKDAKAKLEVLKRKGIGEGNQQYDRITENMQWAIEQENKIRIETGGWLIKNILPWQVN